MRSIAILAMALASAACAPITGPSATGPTRPVAVNPPPCHIFTVPLTVGGRPEQATLEACPQPDGSVRITQKTPRLPPQVYVVPASPAEFYASAYPNYSDYFDYYPYWADEPWFFGLGPTIVVAHEFHHFTAAWAMA